MPSEKTELSVHSNEIMKKENGNSTQGDLTLLTTELPPKTNRHTAQEVLTVLSSDLLAKENETDAQDDLALLSTELLPKANGTVSEGELTVLSSENTPSESRSTIDSLKHYGKLLKIRLRRRKYQVEYVALILATSFLLPWYTTAMSLATSLPLHMVVINWIFVLSYSCYFLGVIGILRVCLFPILLLFAIKTTFHAVDFCYTATRFFNPDYVLRSSLNEIHPIFGNNYTVCGESDVQEPCSEHYAKLFLVDALKSLANLLVMVAYTVALAFVAKDYVWTQKYIKPDRPRPSNIDGVEEQMQLLTAEVEMEGDAHIVHEVMETIIINVVADTGTHTSDVEVGNIKPVDNDPKKNSVFFTDVVQIIDE